MEMTAATKKKGVVFSLDAAIAVTVVIIILINSAYYFSTSSRESLSQLQPVRVGSDIIAILDYTGNLDHIITTDGIGTSFIDETNLNMSFYLPANYKMKLSINDLQESVANKSIVNDPSGACASGPCILQSGDFIELRTLPIQTAGVYYVMVKTDTSGLPLGSNTLEINVNGVNWPLVLPYFDIDGAYVTYRYNLNLGSNTVILTNNHDQPIEIEWFRVLGDDSYALETDDTPSENRFIGTGERIVSAVDVSGNFYGFHNVRYWIWLAQAT